MELSEEQLKIVQATEPRIAVVGPPGTGKTRVLTERIRYLINQGVDPTSIIAITFTNFAANEMKKRLANCSKGIFIGTMHSYALQLLLKHHVPCDIQAMIEKEQFELIIRTAISANMNLDTIKYLFVDEVQDLCDYEFYFVNRLKYENLFLGGDADQCIYQFKGSDPTIFTDYCKNIDTTTYFLTYNYRSGQNIIDYATKFVEDIPGHMDVKVIGDQVNKGLIDRTTFDEAIYNLYASQNYGSWFVLTRTNAELDVAAKKLQEYGLPYVTFKQGDLSNEEIEKFVNSDSIKLLTIHSSKGLEADNIIVIGARNYNNEEKCIEYVAMTRARRKVFWCPTIAVRRPTRKNVVKKKANINVWE